MSIKQLALLDTSAAAIDAEPANADSGTPKATMRWQWQPPFLNADGTVWLHIGYGKWRRYPQDHIRAQVWLESHQSTDDKMRTARAHRLNVFLLGAET